MEYSTRVLESQLDWLTLAVHSERKNLELEHVASDLARDSEARTNDRVPFRLNGYVGWRCGRVRYGTRRAAGLVQLSGDLAQIHFRQLYPLHDSLTRLDLAVTARTPRHDGILGQSHYWSACDWKLIHPQAALPSAIQDQAGGWTTYLGHRACDWFLRIYDKQRECESQHDDEGAVAYENCWRYELETKGRAASVVAQALNGTTDDRQWIRSFVHGYCTSHGILPPWQPGGPPERLHGLRRRSDAESRLRWVTRSVAPSVRWLVDHGYGTDVREALGIDTADDQPQAPDQADSL